MKTIQTTQIKLYGCTHDLMEKHYEMDSFLELLVDQLGMTKIPEHYIGLNPNSFYFDDKLVTGDEVGVTGTILLYESHVAAHAWPHKNGEAYIVISSCKEYDPLMIALWIVGYTQVKSFHFETMKF
jgi:S-adenosylmethionine/arginine decarboxylase-like enzyme